MIKLEERFESAKAESSLLMSYCSSLPFLEQNVLDHLQRAGAGRVTILVDEGDYHASLSDYVRAAGVRYRLHPVRLPHPKANFHPKLYLLLTRTNVRLLVASANLTPSGFRSNLEIVDELSLSDDDRADARAFAQYGRMLNSLIALDSDLSRAVVRVLQIFVDEIERRVGKQVSEAGPRLLHSIDEPLLSQLVATVPPGIVDEIVVISPFFDPKSAAIIELAKAYPKASIRIIKDAKTESLNGQALITLGDRVVVDELASAENGEHRRKLHAKILALRGGEAEWIISGSANLTRPAWLVSASSKQCGNVEAVVVRESAKGTIGRLMQGIKTRRVSCGELHFVKQQDDVEPSGAKFMIVDAQLDSGQITALMEVRTESPSDHTGFRMYVEQGGRRAEYRPTVHTRDKHQLALRADVRNSRMKIDLPVLLTVQYKPEQGQVMVARAWVNLTSALAFNSVQRGVRSSMRDVCRRVFIQEDAASVIAEAIGRFLVDLGGGVRQQSHASARSVKPEETDESLLVDDFIITQQDLGGPHAAANHAAQALSGLALFLEKLLIVAAEEGDELAPADDTEEEEPREVKKPKQEERPTEPRQIKRAEVLLDGFNNAFRSTVSSALSQHVSAAAVPFVLNVPDAVVAFVLGVLDETTG